MILRRITEHVRAQNWFAVGIDFLIVVIGILMAFQITEWAAKRSDLVRERQIIQGFIADIEHDRAEYSSSIASDESRVSAANASLLGAGLPPIDFRWRGRETDLAEYSFEASQLAVEDGNQFERLWSDIVIGYHPTPSTSTYDTLVGAGEMKVIRDARVVRDIQAYHNLQESVVRQTDKLLEIRRDVIGIGASIGLAPYVSVPSDEYFRRVADNPELAAAIRIMATFVIFHHGELEAADAKAQALYSALAAMLQ